jgi:hypothetical protein
LKHRATRIKEEEDGITWSINKTSCNYTTKLGYGARMKEEEGKKNNGCGR